jgi:hypothetical protein
MVSCRKGFFILRHEKKEEYMKKIIIKKTRLLLGVLLCIGFTVPGSLARAMDFNGEWLGEKAGWMPDVSVSTLFLTKYIWRGQNLGNEPVMQFDTSLSKYGLTLDVWGNYSLATDKTVDSGRYQELTELDYTASYGFSAGEALKKVNVDGADILDPLEISGGYTYYTFPNHPGFGVKGAAGSEGSYSHEIFLGCSYDVLLQPFLKWYWDVEAGHGSYLQFGGSHTFDFTGGISADIGLSFAYNYEQWTDKHGWSDMLLSGGVNIPVLKYFTITPNASWSVILDRDTYNDAQSNEFYGGVTIGFAY